MTVKVDIILRDGTLRHHHSKDKGPIFLSDDGVSGTVVVTGLDDSTVEEFDSVKITLFGNMLNVLSVMDIDWPMTELYRMRMGQDLVRLTDCRGVQDAYGTEGTRLFPFCFKVPRQVLTPNGLKEGRELAQCLPSSMNVAFENRSPNSQVHGCRGKSKINYGIRAQLVRNGSVTVEMERPILLFPTLDQEPPVCTSDFPDEYVLSEKKTLRTLFPFRRLGDLLVETSEATPFEFSCQKQSASASVKIKLRYSRACQSCGPPEPFYGTVVSKLRSTTFVSIMPQQRMPTRKEAQRSPWMTKHSTYHMNHKRKLRFSPWKQVKSNGNTQTSHSSEWESEATLVVEYSGDTFPEPTFASSLASRRYALCMSMEIEGCGRTTVDLSVPVNIRYTGKPYDRRPSLLENLSTVLADRLSLGAEALSNQADFLLRTRDEPPIYVA
ncbi:conserved hypothetical protein [Paecilomyces variotii No. 5]|uniref:Arrestin-like N-terminal domain-containing protein n=1 Tax=Byssochlamys spectabilis (strain No. 5 / NBRC 109023) TaxID=1356009 RepID=V5GDA9_BYSSN|nr:conserved hypothetical protein [Paecilomyces variotii No. 5]